MYTNILLAALTLSLFLAPRALAQNDNRSPDGNSLLEKCTEAAKFVDPEKVKTADGAKGMYCIGFLRGVLDTVRLWEATDQSLKNRVPVTRPCLRQDIPNVQIVRIVVKWLNDHPDKLHHDQTLLTLTALQDAFPCK